MTRIPAIALLCALSLSALAAEKVAIVVSDKALASELTLEQVILLYTGKAFKANMAQPVNLVDFRTDLELRDVFYDKLAGRNGRQMHNFWLQHMFSGAGRGPTFVVSPAEMTHTLRTSPRSVGYMWASEVPDDLVVVATINPDAP